MFLITRHSEKVFLPDPIARSWVSIDLHRVSYKERICPAEKWLMFWQSQLKLDPLGQDRSQKDQQCHLDDIKNNQN